ncbi:Hypothetical protein FKW44_018883 [Caligus rogercresseyi]|uniref:Uncharacterized protein n=1 Tax=Caligus rogercresseyi TaxID=217165 RepID=A0A7T8JXS6_CALRO|nr:Hypothetical protein FKW44_018883 [Caligus rogercresseyi]
MKVFAGKLSVASQEISEKLSIIDSVQQVETSQRKWKRFYWTERIRGGRRLMEGGDSEKKNLEKLQ